MIECVQIFSFNLLVYDCSKKGLLLIEKTDFKHFGNRFYIEVSRLNFLILQFLFHLSYTGNLRTMKDHLFT